MAKSNFSRVMDEIFDHEGGYVDHPRDPGGATNYGITHITLAEWRERSVSKQDVRDLTKAEAEEIYRARYWAAVKGDALPYGLDLVAMDGAVNSGPSRGIRWLQKGVGTTADGVIGPKTLEAAYKAPVDSIEKACAARMGFLRALRHWDAFGRGWSRRVASVEAVGVRMWISAAEGHQKARETLHAGAQSATVKAQNARRIGSAQTASTAVGGTGGASVADLPPAATTALALGALVVAGFIFVRGKRKARYQEDRFETLSAEIEKVM